MIDLHCHILPGVDDGCRDWDASLALARQLVDQGVTQVVATPHQMFSDGYHVEPNTIAKLTDGLNQRLSAAQIPLTVLPGAEVRARLRLADRIGQTSSALGDTRVVLIEFPPDDWPSYAEQVLFELRLRGYIPLVAHVERYTPLANDIERVRTMASRGVLFQINSDSLLERGVLAATSARLIDAGVIHVLASDAHDPKWRPPQLTGGYHAVSVHWGEPAAVQLFRENPLTLIKGGLPVPVEVAKSTRRQRSFLERISWWSNHRIASDYSKRSKSTRSR